MPLPLFTFHSSHSALPCLLLPWMGLLQFDAFSARNPPHTDLCTVSCFSPPRDPLGCHLLREASLTTRLKQLLGAPRPGHLPLLTTLSVFAPFIAIQKNQLALFPVHCPFSPLQTLILGLVLFAIPPVPHLPVPRTRSGTKALNCYLKLMQLNA